MSCGRNKILGEGAKGHSPLPYKKLPQTPSPNPVYFLRELAVAWTSAVVM